MKMCTRVQVLTEARDNRLSGAGVSESSEPHDMDVKNQTQVLWKS